MGQASSSREDLARDRVRQIFRFLKAFAERNVPLRRTIADQLWSLRLADLPRHPTIEVAEVVLGKPEEGKEEEEQEREGPGGLIRVRRPKLTNAPAPPAILLDYLPPELNNPNRALEVVPSRNVVRDGETVTERFDDAPARVQALENYRTVWQNWAEAERPVRRAMQVFEQLYHLWGQIQVESESVELMLGDGRLYLQHPNGRLDHPVLLQRVELEFDSAVPEFRISDADRAPELYGALLQTAGTVSSEQFSSLRGELERGGYHPLSKGETSAFLRRLAPLLGPKGSFRESAAGLNAGPDPAIVRDPVLFMRARASGFPAAFDRVLQDLEDAEEIPVSLSRLVGIEEQRWAEEEPVASSPWSEPPDVLLSKPANLEQVQIARALERHRAVVVQGPPGTGKSHTIANLIGHLVAYGKRVLVTSHTTKALRVLRGHVVESLQPLCVALLDSDIEGRTQMEQAVRGILDRLTNATPESLERDVVRFAESRLELINDIERLTADLRTARQAEYLPITIAGEALDPAEAARWVGSNRQGNDWIPGPVEAGAPLPLSSEELRELYGSNARLTQEAEAEIGERLPDIQGIPLPGQFEELCAALAAAESAEQGNWWTRPADEADIGVAENLLDQVQRVAAGHSAREPWQQTITAAGYVGGSEQQVWQGLEALVEEAARTWEKARPVFLEHEPDLAPGGELDQDREVVKQIIAHLDRGRSLGRITLLFRGGWRKALARARVGGQTPRTASQMRAIATYLEVHAVRRRVADRWTRLAVPAGLPSWGALGTPPEPVTREYAAQFAPLLGWWTAQWSTLRGALTTAGFRWDDFRQQQVARSGPARPFDRDMSILAGPLQEVIRARLGVCRQSRALRVLAELEGLLAPHGGPVCLEVRQSVRERKAGRYRQAFAALHQLAGKVTLWQRRAELLGALGRAAPAWAEALRKRLGVHGRDTPPPNALIAWRWRQLRQETDRRAELDEVALMRRLHQRRDRLREVTADLIDRRAWLGQIRRTDLKARMALQGWAATQKKIGKGTGKRAPHLREKARKLLGDAREAVPVWIMPLARVAESFDATRERFDVVIVDEASQSDVQGLLAWYLGDRVAVVGDHEQVSPSAIGQQVDVLRALVNEHLVGIPNSHLYDGLTSIYDLARTSFGGTIALREHFRCVPDIIEFSNHLSYNGDIRPLRNPGAIPRPHAIEYVVTGATGDGREGKRNRGEAQAVVALLNACLEQPEFAGKSFGAITLLGDEQAHLILDLAAEVVGLSELTARKFVAGNSAQFQGDERDVIFLSMVDCSTGGPLALRQTDAFKQRYNVAASRARDHLWLVHSLDPSRDLKAGDLRRALIDHVRDPGARRRQVETASRRAESPFEKDVIERLVRAGYGVTPQVWVGRYRIDMVISDGVRQVALECDGDRFHGFDQIPEDMARQAILERVGWRFIRLRGTRFYRDPEGSMEWVFNELGRHGIEPVGSLSVAALEDGAVSFRWRIARRAWEIMKSKGWIAETDPGPNPSQTEV